MKELKIITPNNFRHKAGDGLKTRKHEVSDLVPALQATPGTTQMSYVLEKDMEDVNYCKGLRLWGFDNCFPLQLAEEDVAMTVLANATSSTAEIPQSTVIIREPSFLEKSSSASIESP